MKKPSQEELFELLNKTYDLALTGIPSTKSCNEIANEYLNKYKNKSSAIDQFVKGQIAMCTASGFFTSVGGLITLPAAVPANVASVMYIQLRMIVTIAIISGKDPTDAEVQTLAYLCLTGASLTKICREFGIQFVNKLTLQMVKKIPGKVLTKINQKVSFRLFTKFGTTGLINLGKLVPVAGGFLGGTIDFLETKAIANRSKNIFLYDNID